MRAGSTFEAHPEIQVLADDVIRSGEEGFQYVCDFLTEHGEDPPTSFSGCEIFIFDVSYAMIDRGGQYWIVTRDGTVLNVFRYTAIIGIP